MTRSLVSVIRVLALRGLGVLISLGTAVGIAFHFGAGPLTDAFFLARRIFGSWGVLIEALCSTLLVPGFVRRARNLATEDYFRAVYRHEFMIFAVGGGLAVLTISFAPQLVSLIAPGLAPEAAQPAAIFFALMALTLPITLATAFAGATLIAIRQFSVPAALRLAPRVLILLAVLLVPLGMGMTGIVVAAVLGNVLMLAALLLVRRRIARQVLSTHTPAQGPSLPEATEGSARGMSLAILGAYFLAVVVSESYVASLVGVGAIAILGLGQRISTLGVSEMLNSVLSVYYTNFSEQADNPDALGDEVRAALRTGLFFTAPLTLSLALLAPTMAQLVLANGDFSVEAAAQAGSLVAWFAVAALFNTAMSVFEMAILSLPERRKTGHFLRACAVTLAVRIGVMVALLPSWGLDAIGLAALLGPLVMVGFHHRFLVARIGPILRPDLRRDFVRLFCAAVPAIGVAALVVWQWPGADTKLSQALMLGVAIGLSAPAYLWLGARLGLDDAQSITERVLRKWRRS